MDRRRRGSEGVLVTVIILLILGMTDVALELFIQ